MSLVQKKRLLVFFLFLDAGIVLWASWRLVIDSQENQEKKQEHKDIFSQIRRERRNILFQYRNSRPQTVYIVGNFNHWDPQANPLNKGENNVWKITLSLEPGEYYYKFLVDNHPLTDPNNPNSVDDGQGGKNSVLIVKPRSPS